MNRNTIVCNLDALDTDERLRRGQLFESLRGAAEGITETDSGYRLTFAAGGQFWMTAAELLDLERRCCPFLRFRLSLDEDARVAIVFGGDEGVKEFLVKELGLPAGSGEPKYRRRVVPVMLAPIAAAAASLVCCVGPVLLAAAGIASAGLGVAVSWLRLPVALGTVGLVGAGYLALYRPFRHRRRGGSETPRAVRLLFWASSAVALAVAFASLVV